MKKKLHFFVLHHKELTKFLLIMRISTLLFLISTLSVSASVYSQSTKLNLTQKEATIRQVFDEIEKQTNYKFFYLNEQIDDKRVIDMTLNNATVDEILGLMFDQTKVKYKVFENNLIVISPTFVSESMQQQLKVSGKITDALTKESLAGVNVVVEGTIIGSISDASGNFTIEITNSKAVLLFSFIGYMKERVEVNGRNSIDISLAPDIQKLDEVVVIGYGTRSKRDVTTAISTVSSDAVQKSLSMSAELAMQGRMTGVQVSGNSGNPMSRPTIRIRGVNTWGVATPLYIIDGVPITEYGAGIEGIEDARAKDIRGPINIMTMIDPNDIESISVLKDASSAAIYGVRAANGVILITTKKGRGDHPVVEFSSRIGIQNISQKSNVLNTQQYTEFVNKVFASDPLVTVNPDNIGRFDINSPRYLGNSPTYDWQDAIKNKNAITQDYSFRLSGGTAKTDYFLSAGATNNDAAFKNNYLNRLSGSFKVNSQVNKWLKIGVNYRVTSGKGMENSVNYIEYGQYTPWQKIYDETNLYGYAPVVVGRQLDGSYKNEKLYGDGTRNNALGQSAANPGTYKTIRNMGNAYIELEPVKHLKIKGSVSMDIYNFTRYNFSDYDGSSFDYTAGDRASIANGNSVGSYEERNVYNNNYINEIIVNYNNTFGDHNIDLLFNGSDQQYDSKVVGASTSWMQSKLPYMRNLGGESKYLGLGSYTTNSALDGLMGRIGYNYKSTYYLDVTVRHDGSARFENAKRWGTFPSASVAWRISNEKFFSGVSFFNDLKLRAGWGQLGNQEVRDLAYLSPINNNPVFAWGIDPTRPIGMGNKYVGAAVYSLPNPNLQWEKTSTTNIGMDASMLNNKLSISFEYFNKLTTGILQTITLPSSLGLIDMPVSNIASVRNTGIELSLNYASSVGDLKYIIGGNLSTVKNIVEKTSGGVPLYNAEANNIEEGYSMNYIRGYKVGGIFQSPKDVDDWKAKFSDDKYTTSKLSPGDYYYQDLRSAPTKINTVYGDSSDNKISQYDLVYLGKTIPGYYYGLNLSLEYKGLDLSAQFTGVGDVQKINSVKRTLQTTGTTNTNVSNDVLNAWSAENQSTTIPRVIGGDPSNNNRFSDRYVESAAYFRLTNLQIGYTLPTKVFGLVNNAISNFRIYVGASNLFTITKYTGYDPENDNYPTPRIFFMGLNVRF